MRPRALRLGVALAGLLAAASASAALAEPAAPASSSVPRGRRSERVKATHVVVGVGHLVGSAPADLEPGVGVALAVPSLRPSARAAPSR